jgi:hypothetical protein
LKSPALPTVVASSLLVLVGLSSCASSSKKSESLRNVDDLLDQIELVHVDCELGGQAAHDALARLEELVDPDFVGDPTLAYGEFVGAIELSEKQASTLGKRIATMEGAAVSVFDKWTQDLEVFSSEKMRERSAQRLEQTRERYQAIVTAAVPSHEAYLQLNAGLRDLAIYLGHDFNQASVSAIQDDVGDLSEMSAVLDGHFDGTLAAAQAYVRASAMPGNMDVAPDPDAEKARAERRAERRAQAEKQGKAKRANRYSANAQSGGE